jgi:hypothetical protein
MRRRRSNALPPHLTPRKPPCTVPTGPLVCGGSDQRYGAPAKSRLHFGEVAIATVAVCLRWGSYLAVLTRHDLSQWTVALDPGVSCIGDGEMALINIEASAALASWIDLMQADQQRFHRLVKSAAQLLPFPIAHLDGSTYYDHFRALGAINSA